MKNFYIVFKIEEKNNYVDKTTERFFRIEIKAVSFGMAEKKFNKQTYNKFKNPKYRIIHEIKLK